MAVPQPFGAINSRGRVGTRMLLATSPAAAAAAPPVSSGAAINSGEEGDNKKVGRIEGRTDEERAYSKSRLFFFFFSRDPSITQSITVL